MIEEDLFYAILSVLTDPGLLMKEEKIVMRYRFRNWAGRWVRFIRTKPSGPFWHETHER